MHLIEVCRWPKGFACRCGCTDVLREFRLRSGKRNRMVFTCSRCGVGVDLYMDPVYRFALRCQHTETMALVCLVYGVSLGDVVSCGELPPDGRYTNLRHARHVLFRELREAGVLSRDIARIFQTTQRRVLDVVDRKPNLVQLWELALARRQKS